MKKALEPAINGDVIAAYFTNWGIYARNYNVVNCVGQGNKMTHILYAFANLLPTGEVVLGDAYADIDNHLPADKTVNGIADDWNETGNNIYGNFKQLFLLKKRFRTLKTSISIGGWTWSSYFGSVAADPVKRQTFIDTAMRFVKDYGFDGIDIDWEYPNNAQEASDYVVLLSETRKALDAYQEQFNQPHFLLTIAAPAGRAYYEILNLHDMQPYLDMIYLMCYDYRGAWDPVTGHQANVYGGDINSDQAINYYINSGIPAKKIAMGLPIYGRGFSNTSVIIGSPYEGIPEGTWETGIFDYKVLPKPGATVQLDRAKIASWSYDPEIRELISYDTPEVIALKCDYIKEKELGGAMFWELSADDVDPNSPQNLVNTTYNELGNTDKTPNHLDYPNSQFDNIRNQMGAKESQNRSGRQSGFQTSHRSVDQIRHQTIYPTGNQSRRQDEHQRRHRNLPKL